MRVERRPSARRGRAVFGGSPKTSCHSLFGAEKKVSTGTRWLGRAAQTRTRPRALPILISEFRLKEQSRECLNLTAPKQRVRAAARGAHAAGVPFSAARRKPRATHFLARKRKLELGHDGLGGPPKPARGPRALPILISECGLKEQSRGCLNLTARPTAAGNNRRSIPPRRWGNSPGPRALSVPAGPP